MQVIPGKGRLVVFVFIAAMILVVAFFGYYSSRPGGQGETPVVEAGLVASGTHPLFYFVITNLTNSTASYLYNVTTIFPSVTNGTGLIPVRVPAGGSFRYTEQFRLVPGASLNISLTVYNSTPTEKKTILYSQTWTAE